MAARQRAWAAVTAHHRQGSGRAAGAPGGTGGPGLLSLVERLDEIPGIGRTAAEVIVAELGSDMRVFPTSGHLVSWAKLAPRTVQSGAKNTSGPTGHGNPWLKGMVGEAATAAARTDTFLGARYRTRGGGRRGRLPRAHRTPACRSTRRGVAAGGRGTHRDRRVPSALSRRRGLRRRGIGPFGAGTSRAELLSQVQVAAQPYAGLAGLACRTVRRRGRPSRGEYFLQGRPSGRRRQRLL